MAATLTCQFANNSGYALTLASRGLTSGLFSNEPDATIANGGTGSWAMTGGGIYNAVVGSATYTIGDSSSQVVLSWSKGGGPDKYTQTRDGNADPDPQVSGDKVVYTLAKITQALPSRSPGAPPGQQRAAAKSGQQTGLSKAGRYNRDKACEYAEKYWALTCSNGLIFMTKPLYRQVYPGRAFVTSTEPEDKWMSLAAADTLTGTEILRGDMEDCTHFTSCCLGRPIDKDAADKQGFTWNSNAQRTDKQKKDPPIVESGGLDLQRQFPFMDLSCGYCTAENMVNYLKSSKIGSLIGTEFMERDSTTVADLINSTTSGFMKGDVIAFSNNGKANGYQHVTFHQGSGNIACHSISRHNTRWTLIGIPYVTLLHIE